MYTVSKGSTGPPGPGVTMTQWSAASPASLVATPSVAKPSVEPYHYIVHVPGWDSYCLQWNNRATTPKIYGDQVPGTCKDAGYKDSVGEYNPTG